MSTTGDPVDDTLGTEDLPAGGTPAGTADGAAGAPATDTNTVTISRDEFNNLTEQVRSLSAIAPFAGEIRNAIASGAFAGTVTRGVEAQPAPGMTEEERMRANMEFGTDPVRRSAEIAEQVTNKRIGDIIAPAQQQINKKFGQIAVENFKASKRDDPYFAAALPIFNQRVGQLPLEQLGGADIDVLNTQLDFIWDAAVGQYARARTDQIKKTKAANISGGGGATGAGGGGKPRRSLAEIDRQAYETAVAAGLPQEEIDAIAAELEG